MTEKTTRQLTEDQQVAFQQTLARQAEARGKLTKEFAGRVETDGLVYTLEWAKTYAVQVALADLWMEVSLRHSNPESPVAGDAVAAVQTVRDSVERALLRNFVHSSSTDAFTNAASAAKAEAFARFHEQAESLLKFLTTDS